MTKQITLEEALKLVSFEYNESDRWVVKYVFGDVERDVCGSVKGNIERMVGGDIGLHVFGDVKGSVGGDIGLHVFGDVKGSVGGTIDNRNWEFTETRKERFQRMLEETGNEQLIDAFNQLENN